MNQFTRDELRALRELTYREVVRLEQSQARCSLSESPDAGRHVAKLLDAARVLDDRVAEEQRRLQQVPA